ncbi:TPA: hypothetical protein EYP13_00070 [Candidatus Micrarchaeota archaeon]|nr:hypothetical protein [Candidatus Micrarchaeota archaeon]
MFLNGNVWEFGVLQVDGGVVLRLRDLNVNSPFRLYAYGGGTVVLENVRTNGRVSLEVSEVVVDGLVAQELCVGCHRRDVQRVDLNSVVVLGEARLYAEERAVLVDVNLPALTVVGVSEQCELVLDGVFIDGVPVVFNPTTVDESGAYFIWSADDWVFGDVNVFYVNVLT